MKAFFNSALVLLLIQATQGKDTHDNNEHGKLPTFQEALYNATHDEHHHHHHHHHHHLDKHHHHHPHHHNHEHGHEHQKDNNKEETLRNLTKQHKIFFEVVRINERLMVDKKNNPLGYNANVHSALYTIDSGRLKRLFVQDMKIAPKPKSSFLQTINLNRFLPNSTQDYKSFSSPSSLGDKIQLWRRLYDLLHLDQPVPALLASIFLGFTATALLYGFFLSLTWLYYKVTGYKPVPEGHGDEENAHGKDDSTEHLLRKEEHRVKLVQPASGY